MPMRLVALCSVIVLVLAGCGSINPLKPYRMEIQQGNHLSQETVGQLKRGMSKDQVRFLLGTPLLTDIFHADRWDYIYRRQAPNSSDVEERRLTVVFEDGQLARVEGDVVPAGGEPEEPQRRSAFSETPQ